MTHGDASALLPRYAAGALEMATAADVRAHLATGCRHCLHELYALPRMTAATVSAAPTPAASNLTSAPVARHSAALGRRPPKDRAASSSSSSAVMAATGFAIAAVAFGLWTLQRPAIGPPSHATTVLARRVAALESERDEIATRIASLTRTLLDMRDGAEHAPAVVTAPGPANAPAAVTAAAEDADSAAAREANPGPAASTASSPSSANAGVPAPVLLSPDVPAPGGSVAAIRYADDLLSMRVTDMPLSDVLQEIERETGVVVRGRPTARDVSVGFEHVPLVQALRRLLGLQNFLLTYSGRHPAILQVLDGGDLPPASRTAVAAGGLQGAQFVVSFLDHRAEVPLGDDLTRVLGARTMSLRGLLDTGVNHVDKTVRELTMRAAVDALQSDPQLRAMMFGARPGAQDGLFGALLDGMESGRAQEALFYVAMQAGDSELRNQAATLIQRLITTGVVHAKS